MKDEKGDMLVIKANNFIQQFKFSLSAAEIQVVNFIIANINSPLYDKEFNVMEFNISDFYKMMGIENPGGSSYEYIKNVIKGLRNKTSDYINFGEYETVVSWIEKPKFYPKSGKVKLKLDDDLKPYLLKANGIMKAQLKYYFKMDSKYSMRLYELLKSWDGYNELKYGFERLRLSIDAIAKSYEKWNAFEKNVLEPAVNEINDITDMSVRYEKVTKGRGGRVTHVIFYYDYKPGMRPVRKEIGEDTTVEKEDKKDEIIDNNKRNELFFKFFGLIAEEFPDYKEEQITALYNASVKNMELYEIDPTDAEKRQLAVLDYIRPKIRKIRATPEETKSTEFNRLYDAVEKNY